MFFITCFFLIFSIFSEENLESILNNLKDGYNFANPEVFKKNFSEKAKEKYDDKILMSFFLNSVMGWGTWKTYKLPPKETEKNIYEIETKFEKKRLNLKLVFSEDGKINDFSFEAIKKVDFEEPKVLSKKINFPLKGSWIVKEGGNNLEKNIFKDSFNKAFALYLQKVDENGNVVDSRGFEVLSPIEANVWQIIDNIEENQKGKPNKFRENGNSIVLKISSEEYLAMTFLKAGSFKVKPGQRVKEGEILALTGFTGNINEPLFGIWVQNNVLEQEGEGIKFYFSCVELFKDNKWEKIENYFPEKGDILRACTN